MIQALRPRTGESERRYASRSDRAHNAEQQAAVQRVHGTFAQSPVLRYFMWHLAPVISSSPLASSTFVAHADKLLRIFRAHNPP